MAPQHSKLNYKNNELHFVDYPLEKIAKALPTPFFLYHEAILKNNFLDFKLAAENCHIPDPLICFALKSNSNAEIIKTLASLGSGADVVSGGELKRALASGIPASKIVFSGVGKTTEELEFALLHDIYSFNIESIEELELLNSLALKHKKIARVAFRMNPTVKPKTHKYISTGNKTHKFGLLLPDIKKALKTKSLWTHTKLVGLSIHIGSQLLDLKATHDAICIMGDFAKKITSLEFLDVGGGLGVDYHPLETKKLPTSMEYMSIVKKALDKSFFKHQPQSKVRIVFEPGRRIIAKTGLLMMKVLRTKKSGSYHFTIVDGGMNDFMRPSLYEAYHGLLPIIKNKSTLTSTIVGPICETSDCFGHQRKISKIKAGDFICLADAGAYGYSMGSQYNLRGKPAEVLITESGDIKIINQAQDYSKLT